MYWENIDIAFLPRARSLILQNLILKEYSVSLFNIICVKNKKTEVIMKKPLIQGVFLVGCLTSIAQVFIGAEAGKIILENASHKGRLIKWAIWAVMLGTCGGFLCNFFENDGLIPVNKNLW